MSPLYELLQGLVHVGIMYDGLPECNYQMSLLAAVKYKSQGSSVALDSSFCIDTPNSDKPNQDTTIRNQTACDPNGRLQLY